MNLFGINSNCAFIFVMSALSGFPSSAKYSKELYEQNLITSNDASKALMFSHFSNPLFLLSTLPLFLNKRIAILIIICHYLTNIIIGIIFRNYHKSNNNSKISISKSISNMNKHKTNNNFGNILAISIKNSIDTLLIILGTITIFLVLTTVINNNIYLNNTYQAILDGLFEMTQGLKYTSLLNISLRYKATISALLISFGGLSIHTQIISVLSGTNIKYYPFLIARILHSIITGLLVYFLFFTI